MSNIILQDVKQHVNVSSTDLSFDLVILDLVNAAVGVLYQLAVVESASINNTSQWSVFNHEGPGLALIKQYIFTKTRVSFDPPSMSFHLEALKEQVKELEFRLNVMFDKSG